MNRRDAIQKIASAVISLPIMKIDQERIITRKIPATLEEVPVVGLGTWQTFDVARDSQDYHRLREVLCLFVEKGGKVIDSSPMYGNSEQVVGLLSEELDLTDKLFLATKVWTTGATAGIAQMEQSIKLLKKNRLDLLQIHNLVDWQTHYKTLRKWKDEGMVRYVGITHYTASAYDKIEQIIRSTPVDFLQINYSITNRKVEERLLPLAQEKQIAVLINRPFEEGALFRRVKDKPLPPVAKEFQCSSWAQFFLKYIIAHPAITCVLAGTSKPHHILDNMGAAYGALPSAEHKRKMIDAFNKL